MTALPLIKIALFTSRHGAQENWHLQWRFVCSITRNQRRILTPVYSPKFAIFHYGGHSNVSTGPYVVVLRSGHHKFNEYSNHRFKFLIKHFDGIKSVATHKNILSAEVQAAIPIEA